MSHALHLICTYITLTKKILALYYALQLLLQMNVVLTVIIHAITVNCDVKTYFVVVHIHTMHADHVL